MATYSIIIPVYNASQWIDKCIVSILNQNNLDYELILINDGSTDLSGTICDEYANRDKHIKVFHTSNHGVSAARNLGIINATGKWLTFIDADDYIEQNYLPTIYNNKADLLIQKWDYTNCKMLEEFPIKSLYDKRKCITHLKENLHRHIFKVPWGKFFKKDIIINNKIKFNENYKLGEDTIFVLQYLKYCICIEYIAESSYKYNRVINSQKYIQDIDTTLSYLSVFFKLYCDLNLTNKIYLNSVFSYLKKVTDIKEHEIQKWENNETIKSIKKHIENKSMFQKIKDLFYKVINHLKIGLI